MLSQLRRVVFIPQRNQALLRFSTYSKQIYDNPAVSTEFYKAANDRNVTAMQKAVEKMEQQGISTGTFIYNHCLSACSWTFDEERLNLILERMKARGIPVDAFTYGIQMKFYNKMGNYEKSEMLFHEMLKNNIPINLHVFNSLLFTYVGMNKIKEAEAIFEEMKSKTLLSYKIMITFYTKMKVESAVEGDRYREKILDLFKKAPLVEGKNEAM